MLKQSLRPIDTWHEVLEAARSRFNLLNELFTALLRDLPGDPVILAAQAGLLTDVSSDLRMDDTRWLGTASMGIEKITGGESTLLPITFLEQGLAAARSVAKVVITLPQGSVTSGTGFLLAGDLLVTNHHVLPDAISVSNCRCLFDYRHLATGALSEGNVETPAADGEFRTSANDDISVVRLGRGTNDRWGQLSLSAGSPPGRLSPANIIQHPGGRPKEIGFHHNFVMFSDEQRIQYLTDTEPGSSGAPVFDNRWMVIAVHHSGGRIPEPGTGRKFYRNEGISATRVRRLLVDWNLHVPINHG